MEKHFKQLIIARRDLNMSPGKLAAQVSSAFLIEMIRDSWPEKVQDFYQVNYRLDKDVYDNWINDGVTKVVCGARNRGKLEKAIEKAKELGMIEGPIVDACRTELTPESPQGTLTCVGFRPMEVKGRSPFLGYLNITTWFLRGCSRNPKMKMVFEIFMA